MHCIFTGQATDSEEHVFPRWLQKRFSLGNETLVIPNGTTLKYKHHRVPAEREANARFGDIENRISRGVFDPVEVYLWAFKLHLGCIYRDATLRFDIKNPDSLFILDVHDFAQEVWLFHQLFALWRSGGGTDPSPFGSVFIVDSLHPTPTFDFMHCLITGAVAVNIGSKFIFVLLYDQGAATRGNILKIWQDHHVPSARAMAGTKDFDSYCYMAHHVWACETAYGAYRRRRGISFLKTSKALVAVPSMSPASSRVPEENEYRNVCRSFGLDLVTFNGEVNNHYTQATLSGRSPVAA